MTTAAPVFKKGPVLTGLFSFIGMEYREELKKELIAIHSYEPVHKDILVVVRDQYEYVRACIESIQKNTEEFTLFIWDNNSAEPTASYLRSIDAIYHRAEKNL